jgi:class 3 adenylate cyclase
MTASDLRLRLDALRTRDVVPAAAIDALADHLAAAPDEALFRMSPLRFAATRGLAEQQAIDLFLHATHAGILEFAWGVLCPGCLAFLTTPGSLRSLQRTRHCSFCNIEIQGSIDDRVEVAFTVSPSVRKIRFHAPEALDLRADGMRLYFSSSLAPASPPHRRLAETLLSADRAAPGGVHVARVELPEGHNALLAPTTHTAVYLRASPGGPAEASIELLDDCAIQHAIDVGPGPVTLRIHNRTARPLGFMVVPVCMTGWPEVPALGAPLNHPTEPYLTGTRLVTAQTFRDLFRAESIPSEGGLELKALTLLFTDLKGSTAIYERVGDLRAYDLVRRHFALLREIAHAEGGAIVKTIGDAVMASFAEPRAAMRAAVAMRREIARLGEGELLLKIGVHAGPCIAVELNDRLDYFGRTVNIAARVEGVASAGEIVCTEPVYAATGVRELIDAAGLSATRAAVPLKGIAGEVAVVRLGA